MSNSVSALRGASYAGFVQIEEVGLQGMISLRGDLARLAKPVKSATGCDMPDPRAIVLAKETAVAWMSPDELLLLVPYGDVSKTVAKLEKALAKAHALVTDVSDARAMFRITGDKADQVLAKLCPVDFETLPAGEIRRTRAAQVAAAFWRSGDDQLTLISFRSVAGYVMRLLETAAQPGSEIS